MDNLPISRVSPGSFMNPDAVAGHFGLSEGMAVADFGCGSGHFTIIMAKMVGENGIVTAVDIMDEPLEAIAIKARIEGLKNIKWVKGNLEVLGSSKLANGSQDMILLANILFQSNLKKEIIAEANRALKPGGILVIIDWRKGAGGGPPDIQRLSPEGMQSLVSELNLVFMGPIDSGVFHYGLKFQKPLTNER